jgi:O-antigen/teichoic acid export membrane protein
MTAGFRKWIGRSLPSAEGDRRHPLSPLGFGANGRRPVDHLVGNALWIVLTTFTQGALGFIFWVLCAHLYSTSDIGIGTTMITATYMISFFALLGFNNSFVRFLPTSKDRSTDINSGVLIVFLMAMALAAIYVGLLPVVAPRLDFVNSSAFYFIAFVILNAFAAVNLVTDAVFIAFRSAKYNFVVDGLLVGSTKLIVPALVVGLGAFGIFFSYGIAAFGGVMLSLFLMVRYLSYRPSVQIRPSAVRKVLAFSAANYLANVFDLLPVLVLPLLIVDRIGTASAGYYFIAFQIANLLFAVGYAVSQSLNAEGSYGDQELSALVRRISVLAAVTVVPAAAAVAIGSRLILGVFGASYSRHAQGALIFFALAAPLVVALGINTALMRITKQTLGLVLANLTYAIVIIGLAVLWVHRGITWVGLAWLLGTLAACVVSGVFLWFGRSRLRTVEQAPRATDGEGAESPAATSGVSRNQETLASRQAPRPFGMLQLGLFGWSVPTAGGYRR